MQSGPSWQASLRANLTSAWRAITSALGAAPGGTIHVDPAIRYQTVEGWGTSLAWWGHVIGGWSDAKRNAIADLVFSPTAGLGLNVVRYNIGGGDDPAHHPSVFSDDLLCSQRY